ncbi:MAG: hypothetical protein CM15mP68_1080 [Pseudomonadota bacterium]|nr:MAG: hypothetical protein CM15mP68_1080 [Pseudomonadota bacterium]
MLAGFTALYVVVPNSTVPLRHGLLGGALTTLVFQLAFEGFATASQYFVYDAVTALLLPYLHFVVAVSGMGNCFKWRNLCAFLIVTQ